MDACSICDSTENILTICLGCSANVDFTRMKVYTCIYNSRTGLSISQIKMRLGAHRNTVSYHVKRLEKEGIIHIKHFGRIKLCRVPGKHTQV